MKRKERRAWELEALTSKIRKLFPQYTFQHSLQEDKKDLPTSSNDYTIFARGVKESDISNVHEAMTEILTLLAESEEKEIPTYIVLQH